MSQDFNGRELAEKIIKNEHLRPGDKISYDRLIELSGKYGITPKVLAVSVFGATQPQFVGLKNKSSNAKSFVILKNQISDEIEDAVKNRSLIMESENLKEGSTIDYEMLQYLSIKYDIPVKILAVNVFQISDYSFRKIKNDFSKKAVIMFKQKSSDLRSAKKDDETEAFRKKVLEEGNLKIGDKINYETLKKLAQSNGIDVEKLAFDILGLSTSAFYHIKRDSKRNAVVLKGFLGKEEIKSLSEKIYSAEGIKPYTQIDYAALTKLSEKYLITEKILAYDVLGLSETQYWGLKYKSESKAYVLKGEETKTSPKEVGAIKERIFQEENITYGCRITLDQIENIRSKYELQLNEALYVLGLTRYSYDSLKRGSGYFTIVKDIEKYSTTQIISQLMEKERYYSKEEIEKICIDNKISVRDFIDYIIGRGIYFGLDNYEKILSETGRIWIGSKKAVSDGFVAENYERLEKIAKSIGKRLYYNDNIDKGRFSIEDLKQEAWVCMLERCGDLEKNYEGDQAFRLIYSRTRRIMMNNSTLKVKTVSVSGFYKNAKERRLKADDKNVDLDIKDEKVDVEGEALEKFEKEKRSENPSSVIEYLSDLVGKGYDRETALEQTAQKFNLDKKSMVKELQDELIRRGKVRKSGDGDYYFTRD